MRNRSSAAFLFLTLVGSAWLSQLWAAGPVSIRGRVTAKGSPLEGAYIAAHATGKTFTTYVMTDRSGQFSFRGLAPGRYAVLTRIPGFRAVQKDGLSVQVGKEAVADFQVEPETRFLELVEQASNAELQESFPLTPEQREALDYRCADCHGAYYLAKSRFPLQDWALIVAKMDDQKAITPAGDISPPPRMSRPSARGAGSNDELIVSLLAQIRGPESLDFPIKFRPRATGELTRAVVTEYEIPRRGATPRSVRIDPRGGYAWYTDWRANYLGRIDIRTGEMKEYPIPGRQDRPPGFQYIRWDPMGNLLAGQIWTGRGVRFDVKNEKLAGIWAAPLEWARTGSVGICRSRSDGRVVYVIGDALVGEQRWIVDPETDQLTEIQEGGGEQRMECSSERDENPWAGAWSSSGGKRAISYRESETGKTTEFLISIPWARPYNAVGDPLRKVAWTAPDVIDSVVKVDANTGHLTQFPLPSHGKEVRTIDIEMSANPPAVWFVNQRLGRIIRFQEYTE